MKKVITIAIMFIFVPMLFGADNICRTIDGSVKVLPSRAGSVEKQMPQPTGRQQILFVQDPGNVGPPMPDQYWDAVLDSVVGSSEYTLWGPTTSETQPGPDLPTMQGYALVIWDTYDYWNPALGPALTSTDQTNVADYITGGGKVWLIGQDVLWSGTAMGFMTTNFGLQSAYQDYNGGAPGEVPYPCAGVDELAGYGWSFLVDWGSDVFPDDLTPTADAHECINDVNNPSYYPAIIRNDYTSSFWTVDGRNPSPWGDWQEIVSIMLDLFLGGGAASDVGTNSIDITSPLPWNTTLAPQATVKNFGTAMQTFDVTCEIEPGGYSSTKNVADLAAGDSTPVTFTPDFTFVTGSYDVTVYTQLGGDEDPSNDTLTAVIDTYDPGVAEDGSLIPTKFGFNASTINTGRTSIVLALPAAVHVDLVVYDALGRLRTTIVSDRLSVGTHRFDAQFNLPAGVYFYNLKTDTGEQVMEKFMIVR